MKTKITELLGIEYPVIQGGMAWVAEHNLAAAVSNAGGLGLIGAASAPAEIVRDEIRKCRELTDKPFGVNVMLLNPNADEVAKVIVEEGVKVVTTGAGNPAKYMEMWKEAGVKVIPVVASVALASREIIKLKQELYNIISEHSGQPYDKVYADSDRDYWMTSQEALEYGMIDKVLVRSK